MKSTWRYWAMLFFAGISIFLLVTMGFRETNQGETRDIFNIIQVSKNTKGVILPEQTSLLIFPQCSRASPDRAVKTWQVEEDQVMELERNFQAFVDSNNLNIPHGGLPNYYRQYIGILENGNKYIYVNGFHKSIIDRFQKLLSNKSIEQREEKKVAELLSQYIDIKLLSEPITAWQYWVVNVCDGGDEYFGAYYDVKAKKFVSFRFSHNTGGVRPGIAN